MACGATLASHATPPPPPARGRPRRGRPSRGARPRPGSPDPLPAARRARPSAVRARPGPLPPLLAAMAPAPPGSAASAQSTARALAVACSRSAPGSPVLPSRPRGPRPKAQPACLWCATGARLARPWRPRHGPASPLFTWPARGSARRGLLAQPARDSAAWGGASDSAQRASMAPGAWCVRRGCPSRGAAPARCGAPPGVLARPQLTCGSPRDLLVAACIVRGSPSAACSQQWLARVRSSGPLPRTARSRSLFVRARSSARRDLVSQLDPARGNPCAEACSVARVTIHMF
jgi:hypothetical protein